MSKTNFRTVNAVIHKYAFQDLLPTILVDVSKNMVVDANYPAISHFNLSLPHEISSHLLIDLKKNISDKKLYFHTTLNNSRNYLFYIYPVQTINQRYYYLRVFPKNLESIDELNNAFFLNNVTPMMLLDEAGNIKYLNEHGHTLVKNMPGEIINENIFTKFISGNYSNFSQIKRTLELGEIVIIPQVVISGDDKDIIQDLILLPIFHKAKLIGVQTIFNEINVDLSKNTSLDSQTIYQLMIEHLNDGVMLLSPNNQAVFVNDKYRKIFGFERNEVVGRKINLIDTAINSSNQSYYFEERLKLTGSYNGEVWMMKKDGSIIPVWLNLFIIKEKESSDYRQVAIFKDLTEVSEINTKFLSLIHKDPLTALYNKYIFIERVSSRLQLDPENNHWILFIDLNNFKPINDMYGHDVGDMTLATFARKLKHIFIKHMTARFGGDEFLIYFGSNNEEKNIYKLIEDFKEMIKEPLNVDGIQIKINASVGLGRYPDQGKTVYELIKYADNKMYEDKDKGSK